MESIFISDLHLDKTRPGTVNCFMEFIKDRLPTMENLYILGDFVESWVGDDDPMDGLEEVRDASLAEKARSLLGRLRHPQRRLEQVRAASVAGERRHLRGRLRDA